MVLNFFCDLKAKIPSSRNLSTHIVHVGTKRAHWLLLSWLKIIVNKDSFESAEAGLFASKSANNAEVCAETSKRKRRQRIKTHKDKDLSILQRQLEVS